MITGKNSHCSYCGEPFADADGPWPRQCSRCDNRSYLNPLPVSVVLLPVGGDGLLLIRRAIPPREGMLALPGGFIGVGESWQEAGAREVREETGIVIDPAQIRLFDARSAPDGTVLIFGIAEPGLFEAHLPAFVPNHETSEMVIARGPVELAFPLHTETAERFWRERAP